MLVVIKGVARETMDTDICLGSQLVSRGYNEVYHFWGPPDQGEDVRN